MTHTAHPYGFRLGITRDWQVQWFAGNREKYRQMLREDYLIRSFLEKELANKQVSTILLERELERGKETKETFVITIKTSRPGLIIGREGLGIEDLISRIKQFSRKNGLNEKINVRIEEVRYVEQDATLIAESIVDALKQHIRFNRAIKQSLEKVMANRNVKGCRIVIAGRLGGAEIARTESVKRGKIPLQTLRADIDYAHKEAIMSYGVIGIKVWVYKGDIVTKK